MSVSYGGDKITFDDGSTVGSGWAGFKNRIINGAMNIAQRTTSSLTLNSSSGDQYPVDRFHGIADTTSGVFTLQQSADVPTGQGFKNSIVATVTTADASLSGNDSAAIRHIIEGNNVSDLMWGSDSAKPVTLSFWMKSSVVGTHSGTLTNGDWTRTYPFTYTVSLANTWQYVAVTVPGATLGSWGNGNDRGIQVVFNLGASSTRLATGNTWSTTSTVTTGATGSVQLVSTVNSTFFVTGVQLEKGTQDTSFEYRPYGTELQLCQRYCQTITRAINSLSVGLSYKQGGSYILTNISYSTMRAAPSWNNPPTSWRTDGDMTPTQAAAYDFTNSNFVTITGTLTTINQLAPNHGRIYVQSSSSFSGGSGGGAFGLAFGADLLFTAEL
jgi:hypothetical protein